MKSAPSRVARTRAETISPAKMITDAIIARLEAGVSPWRRTWATSRGYSGRPMRACGQPYRGINALWLWVVADANGYISPTWMTYRQATGLGGQVRKGERSTIAVFYKTYVARDAAGGADTNDGDDDRTRRVMKSYNVFNVAQIDGLPARFAPPSPLLIEPGSPQEEAHRAEIDAFIAGTGAAIVHGGNEACYYPSLDTIHLPQPATFDTYAAYGATAAHELTHWTGHPNRLNRDLANRFGSDAYAAEELVAELGSALIGADLGLPVTHLDNHASYIDHWLRILRADERALMTAAARAEEAATFLLARAPGTADDDDDEPGDASSGDEPVAMSFPLAA
jgi:antirestriction protein ArdC